MSNSLDYRAAGVDIDAADDAKRRITAHVLSTLTPGARGEFGGFGGMFRVPTDVPKPVLVASADGVGTKLKVAIEAGRYDTVGHDLVNHCVNDILVQGASPLFFLDYVAFGALDPRIGQRGEVVPDAVAHRLVHGHLRGEIWVPETHSMAPAISISKADY